MILLQKDDGSYLLKRPQVAKDVEIERSSEVTTYAVLTLRQSGSWIIHDEWPIERC